MNASINAGIGAAIDSGAVQRFRALAINPWIVLACVALGAAIGATVPSVGRGLAVVGTAYVDLLTMVVLPFMMSAVVLSLQNLTRERGAARVIWRVVLVFAALMLAAALLAAAATMLLRPGSAMSEGTRAALGSIIGGDGERGNVVMALLTPETAPTHAGDQDLLRMLVPSNIFAALANGDMLKALVFALLFGFAIGHVPARITAGLQQALESVYQACQTLTVWINLPLPLMLVCMAAGQVARTGLGPLAAMASFVGGFLLVSVLLGGLALALLRRRANVGIGEAMAAMREPFALGVATNNSAACMPAMVAALADRLGFVRSRVELLVPLSTALLRVGTVAYFVCGTMFIAALYGQALSFIDMIMLVGLAALTGFASTGMAGAVTVSMMGLICAHLSLPFDAAFVLFVAIDPLCAMARTAVTVLVNCAAVALVCARPLPR
jgi:Na+/H+-dicarboxylate symporter